MLGGNLRNNVVRALGEGLAQGGLATLRFDYRGVGRSQGPHLDLEQHLAEFWRTSHAPDEMAFGHDLLGAVNFIQQELPGLPLALIGYSFGCALLPGVTSPDLAALVAIAPTVTKHPFDAYLSVTAPLLVVASEDDFATDSQRLAEWYGALSMPRQLIRQKCDNHFFRGHEGWLVEKIRRFLDEHWR